MIKWEREKKGRRDKPFSHGRILAVIGLFTPALKLLGVLVFILKTKINEKCRKRFSEDFCFCSNL